MAYHLVTSREQLREVYLRLKKRKHIAIDTEYDAPVAEWARRLAEDLARERGKKPKVPNVSDKSKINLVGLSVADKDDTWYVPCSLLTKETVQKFAKALLDIEGLTVWAHNWRAEWASLGITMPELAKARLGDTMLAAWSTEYGEPYYDNGKIKYRYGLKPVIKMAFGITMTEYKDVVGGKVLVSGLSDEDNDALYAKELDELHKAKAPKPPFKKELELVRKAYNKRKREQVWRDKVASDIAPEDIKDYACADADMTLKLARVLVKRLRDFEYTDVFWNVEMPTAQIIDEMESDGLTIDVEYFKAQKARLHDELRVLEQRWFKATGIDIRKDKQVAEAVYNTLKCWQVGEACKTDKGNLSVNKKALAYVLQMCPEGSLGRELALIKQEHSKLYKLANTYMNVFIYQGMYNDDGKLHCDILQTGTNTGRFAMKNPNIQSTPKEIIRDGLRAPEGWALVDADWCVSPDTLLLTEDLQWVRADSVMVGQHLVGFPEQFSGFSHKLKRSTVEVTKKVRKHTLRVHTNLGHVDISTDHLLVTGGSGRKRRWIRGDQLRVGTKLIYFCKPWSFDDSREAGWYAGFLDGEGYFGAGLGWGQNPGVVAERAEAFQEQRGWSFRKNKVQATGARPGYRCVKYEAVGHLQGLDIVGSVRPSRLLSKAISTLYTRRTHGRYTPQAYVTRIEDLGVQDLCAIQTSERTFIANGFLSHNCGLEVVVMGHYSKDANIAEIVLTGKSQHDITAAALGIERDRAKPVNFSLNYGGGSVTVSKSMFIPLKRFRRRDGSEGLCAQEHVREWVRKYHETYSGVTQYRKDIADECRAKGYVATVLGRRRYLPDIRHPDNGIRFKAERQAANTPIQGTAADIAKVAMIKLWRHWRARNSSTKILLQVHDEILVMCLEHEAELVKREMAEIMANPGIELSLPLKAEVGVGNSWAAAK